jgi:hypothetical protein
VVREGSQRSLRALLDISHQKLVLEGFVAILDGWFGLGGSIGWDPTVAAVLLENQQSLLEYEEAGRDLRNTRRQISQKENDYSVALEEQQAASAELRRREQALDQAVDWLSTSKERSQTRLHELEAAERARVSRNKAATGGGEASKQSEVELAQDHLVAEAVAPISGKEYMDLYRMSAREYGFGPDWYVLMAVGKVESEHGSLQRRCDGSDAVLPSTWETSGVDGNGDGAANIVDPEDAIPAAAGYLKVGGAPQDWYMALYSYNHADW